MANLFYRGLVLRRAARDRRHAAHDDRGRRARAEPRRAGAAPTGLAVLRIRTVDQEERPVLDFTRCAMLPLRDEPDRRAGDEVGGAAELDAEPLRAAVDGLGSRRYRAAVAGPHFDDLADGRAGRSRAATSSTRRPSWRG